MALTSCARLPTFPSGTLRGPPSTTAAQGLLPGGEQGWASARTQSPHGASSAGGRTTMIIMCCAVACASSAAASALQTGGPSSRCRAWGSGTGVPCAHTRGAGVKQACCWGRMM